MTEPNRRVRRFIHILGTQRCMYFIEPPISWIRLTVHDSTLPPPPYFPPPNPFQSSKGRPPKAHRTWLSSGGAPNPEEPRTPTHQGRRRRHTRTRPHTNDARDKHARLAHVFFRASSASARRRYVRATRLDAPNDRRSTTTMTTTARLARRPSALDDDEHARRRATRRSSETDSERGIFTHRETTRRRARRRASGVPGRRRRRRRRRETAVVEERKGRGAPRVGVGEGV